MNTPTQRVATLKEIRSFGFIFSLLIVLIFGALLPRFNQPMHCGPVVGATTALLAWLAPATLRLHSLFINWVPCSLSLILGSFCLLSSSVFFYRLASLCGLLNEIFWESPLPLIAMQAQPALGMDHLERPY